MLRGIGRALGTAALLATLSGEARAQFGYGYYPAGYGGYGWGGWGGTGTVQGDIARGLGYFNVGAGIYNEKTAVANSIDTDTAIRWNQYLYLSQQEANRREYLRRARIQARDSASGDQILKRIRENPEDRDVVNGDALNVVLDQVTDPKVHSSALRMANTSIKGATIRSIPFTSATEAVTISLNRLTAEDGWPAALRGRTYAQDRDDYQRLISQALEQDEKGEIAPETLDQLRDVLARMRERLKAEPPQGDRPAGIEAENYLKTLTGMVRLLDRPEVDKILAELDSIKTTSLGSMLGFMHTFNLRFAPAQNDQQRAIYREIYPLMAAHRDRILKDSGISRASAVASRKVEKPIDFFRAMHLDHIEGKGDDGDDAK